MKSISLALSLAASAAVMSMSPVAQAAEGSVCYSGIFTYTLGSGTSVSYPQFGNTTVFYCAATVPASTIPQLSQAGWTISSVQEVPYSQTVNSDGSSTGKMRIRLIIQRNIP